MVLKQTLNAIFSLSLIFGKIQLDSSQSSNLILDNKIIHEKAIDNQELYSVKYDNQQVISIKIGDNKYSVPTKYKRNQPSNFPISSAPVRNKPSRNTPKYRKAPKIAPTRGPGWGAGGNPSSPDGSGEPIEFDDQYSTSVNKEPQLSFIRQNQKKKNKKKKKNSTEVNKKRVIEAYQTFISEMNDRTCQINISEDRFVKLSKNPQTGKFDEKSIFEAEGGLQGEIDGLYSNLQRPNNPKVDLDFQATSARTGETIFIDHKGMIDFSSLIDKGKNISSFPNHENVAFNMGKKSVEQKKRFIGLNEGPKSKKDVIHLYNFKNIRNNAEKPFLVQAVLNGAEQAGYTEGILFLNYE